MENQNSKSEQSTSATVPVQTCGLYVAGNFTAKNVSNFIGSSSSASQVTNKSPFRVNVPTPTQHYKGRQDTLEEIHKFFTELPKKSSNCWERMIAIVGLGGMGKTETACKYAAEYREALPNAAWVNAETEQGMLNSFLSLAKHLEIVQADQMSADLNLVKQVYRHIDKAYDNGVLFIFDNAIQLNSVESELGILDYLPTDDLANQRFPNIIITTQTPGWGRIKTLQVEELRENEALEFFSSCFKVKSSECADEFKMLHELLEGYPLCMNLAASSIDYDPNKDSISHLRQEIKLYVDKVKNEQMKIISEKIKPAWGIKYNKTLLSVWQLTLQRLEQEEEGSEALNVLQIMSFLRVPFDSGDVERILLLNTECPHLEKDMQFQMKVLFRVLERLFVIRILKVYRDDENVFKCDLGVHRLVQLVVRQQTNCSHALECILLYVSRKECLHFTVNVSESAIEEVLQSPRTQLTPLAVPFVAILACHGSNTTARNFVDTRPLDTNAAATCRHLWSMVAGATSTNENTFQGIREVVGLTMSSDRQMERKVFAEIALILLYPDLATRKSREKYKFLLLQNFNAEIMEDVEDLTVELILNICALKVSKCYLVRCPIFDTIVVELIAKLVTGVVQSDAQEPKSVFVERIATTWLAFLAKQRDYLPLYESRWYYFWDSIYETFHSTQVSPFKTGQLITCLWKRGLSKELIDAFELYEPADWRYRSALPHCMDICLTGMDLRDRHVKQVISEFTNMTARCYSGIVDSSSGLTFSNELLANLALDICLVWIKLLLVDGDRTSDNLLECLSLCGALKWLQITWEDIICKMIQDDFWSRNYGIYPRYRREYLPQFIRKYASCKVREIQILKSVCSLLATYIPPIESE